ncbi:MAG TPA: hypothetical protein VJ437_10400 [Acidiferrobacterales bacterium]|nr:hypothetical protein [Acidiferrobacterales bacterium]
MICSALLGAIALMLVAAAPARAATYYVDSARPDDSGDGASWATAKRTIQAGAELLASADTLKVKSGGYPAFFLRNRSFSSWTRIETDDGGGNPGLVSITGGVTSGYGGSTTAGIEIQNVSYLRIDGRQPGGFTVLGDAGGPAIGVVAWHWANVHNISIRYVDVIGTRGGEFAIGTAGYGNVEIGFCRVDASATYLIYVMGSGTGDPNNVGTGSIHHCDVRGAALEVVIGVTRFGHCEVYNNYVHDTTPIDEPYVVPLRVRNGNDNRFYNNVVWVQPASGYQSVFQARAGGGATLVNRNEWFNNTVILDAPVLHSVVFFSEDANNNRAYNNLIVGDANVFSNTWTLTGSNNEIFDNVITGGLNRWFASPAVEAGYSVTSGGAANAGTQFLRLAGGRPSPFWDLSASQDGAAVAGLTTDYDGNPRGSPPDVGAFEYTTGGDMLAPAAPTNLTVQ